MIQYVRCLRSTALFVGILVAVVLIGCLGIKNVHYDDSLFAERKDGTAQIYIGACEYRENGDDIYWENAKYVFSNYENIPYITCDLNWSQGDDARAFLFPQGGTPLNDWLYIYNWAANTGEANIFSSHTIAWQAVFENRILCLQAIVYSNYPTDIAPGSVNPSRIWPIKYGDGSGGGMGGGGGGGEEPPYTSLKKKLTRRSFYDQYTSGLPLFHIMPLDPTMNYYKSIALYEKEEYWPTGAPQTLGHARGDGSLVNSGAYMYNHWDGPGYVRISSNRSTDGQPVSLDTYRSVLEHAKTNDPQNWNHYIWPFSSEDDSYGFHQAEYVHLPLWPDYTKDGDERYKNEPPFEDWEEFGNWCEALRLGDNCWNFVLRAFYDVGIDEDVSYEDDLADYPINSTYSMFTEEGYWDENSHQNPANAEPGDIIVYTWAGSDPHHVGILAQKATKVEDYTVYSCMGNWSIFHMGAAEHQLGDLRTDAYGGAMAEDDWPPSARNWNPTAQYYLSVPEKEL